LIDNGAGPNHHLRMPISDTSPEIAAMQAEILRRMSFSQKFAALSELCELTRELARAGVRREHPEWTEAQVVRELLRIALLPVPLPAALE
jgi:hypothetical protein